MPKTTQDSYGLSTGCPAGFDIYHRISDHQAIINWYTHAFSSPQDLIRVRLGVLTGMGGGNANKKLLQLELFQEAHGTPLAPGTDNAQRITLTERL